MTSAPSVVIVAGMHRSGTSLVASMLACLGISMGERQLPADGNNQHGYFEDLDFLALHRRMLPAAVRNDDGGHPDWGWTESEAFDRAQFEPFRAEAQALIAARARGGGRWGWKDPRTTLALDFWDKLTEARYVLVYRHPWAVADSMQRLGAAVFLDHPDYAYRIWAYYNRRLLDFFQRTRERSILISSQALVLQPDRLVELVRERLHLEIPTVHLGDLVDGALLQSLDPADPLASLLAATRPECTKLLGELDRAADLSSAGLWTVSAPRCPTSSTSTRLSVVVPCFDQGEYLIEAVASVERSVPEPCELIIVNDGSREPRTLEVLNVLRRAGYEVVDQENSGLAAARNRGIELARGPYVLPLDADNRLRPGFVPGALAILDARPEVGVVYGDRHDFGLRNGTVDVPPFDRDALLSFNFIDACALLRKNLWRDCGGYDAGMPAPGWEDWDLWIGAAERGWQFQHLPGEAFDYRVRPQSMLSTLADEERRRRLYEYVIAKYRDLYWQRLPEILVAAQRSATQLFKLAREHERLHAEAGAALQAQAAELVSRDRAINALRAERDSLYGELAAMKFVLCAREDNLASIKALGVHAMPGPVICTIVCKNYLAHARCLAQSFLAHHPDGRVFVALADRVDGYFDPAAEPFTVVEAHELNIPEFDQMAFRYTLVEFNTAVKPFFLEYLFNRYDLPSVCYFDPDIYFYQPITLIEDLLTKHTAVLVPHITESLDDNRLPDEPFIMRAGVYNLGFIGLSRRPEMYDLLHWWQKKLLKECVIDTTRGLFVDQRWMDLAPSLFEGIAILRDPGFDVAYWNLNGRRMRRDGDQWLVNDQPLVFYHFSGLMLSDLNAISKHQNRYTLRDLPDLKPLFEHYRERLNVNDFRTVSGWPYAYGRFDNGVPIPDMARHLWRGLNGETRWPQPFIVEGADSFFNWLNRGVDGGRPLVTNLAMELYRQRWDVQQSFPDVLGVHREGYARWFIESAENYAHFDAAFAQPVTESLPAASETPTLRLRVDALYRTLVLRQPIVPLLGRPTWYRQVYCVVRNPLRRLGLHRALKRLLGRSLVEKIDRRILFGHRVSVEDVLRSASAPPAHDVFSTSHDAGSPQPAAPPHGLNVVGYVRTETGVGEVARSILRALAALDFPTAQTDLSNPEWARADDDSVTHLPAGHPYDFNLLCVNADMLPYTVNQLGSRFFAGKHNIGFWHWETTHFPRKWFDRFAHLNEIWVDSGFMQKHLAEVSPIPVVNVGLPVNGLVSSGVGRGDIGLPEDRFLFLFSFDARSYIQRKNPHGLIEAYRRAFGSAFDQTMPIIKATNLDEFSQEAAALRADVESVGGRLIARYMDRQELSGLFRACDAYVSLHRSEGFGLTIAEAMALGKPVIATAYSGNMEFMTPSNSYLVGYRLTIIDGDYGPYRCGGEWADPDLDHAAELMRLVFADRAGAAAKGAQAAADMRRGFGNAAVGRRIIARLERIRQERNGH